MYSLQYKKCLGSVSYNPKNAGSRICKWNTQVKLEKFESRA